jgi:hypothetical protein
MAASPADELTDSKKAALGMASAVALAGSLEDVVALKLGALVAANSGTMRSMLVWRCVTAFVTPC